MTPPPLWHFSKIHPIWQRDPSLKKEGTSEVATMIGEEQRKDVEKSAKSKSDGGDFVVVVVHKQGRQDADHDAHTPETSVYFPQDLMMELTRPSVDCGVVPGDRTILDLPVV